MPIEFAELTRRLERADRARLALRRATLELQGLGAELRQALGQRPEQINGKSEQYHRPFRTHALLPPWAVIFRRPSIRRNLICSFARAACGL